MPIIKKAEAKSVIRYSKMNLERARNLFKLFDELKPNNVGRTTNQHKDILRASVVFTHATIDNLIRSLFRLYLKSCSHAEFKDEAKKARFESITFEDLYENKSISIGEFLENRAKAIADFKSFNSSGEVFKYLALFSITPTLSNTKKGHITALITRRHNIVHRYDEHPNRGQHGVTISEDIARDTVEKWIASASELVDNIESEIKKWS